SESACWARDTPSRSSDRRAKVLAPTATFRPWNSRLSSFSALTDLAFLLFLVFRFEPDRVRVAGFLTLALVRRVRTFFADFGVDLDMFFFFDAMDGSLSPKNVARC